MIKELCYKDKWNRNREDEAVTLDNPKLIHLEVDLLVWSLPQGREMIKELCYKDSSFLVLH